MTDFKKDQSIFNVGERVFVKPYDCSGRVTKVEWQEELKLRPDYSIALWFCLLGRARRTRTKTARIQ